MILSYIKTFFKMLIEFSIGLLNMYYFVIHTYKHLHCIKICISLPGKKLAHRPYMKIRTHAFFQ